MAEQLLATFLILAWRKFGVNAASNFPLNLRSMQFSHRFWRAFYDRTAFAYDAILRAGIWLRVGSEERIRKEVIGAQALTAGARVLEVGCGSASNRLFLAADIHYVGVDISRNMLKAAQSKCDKAGLGADFVQADAAALPISKSFADLVLAMGVLQHVLIPKAAMKQMETAAKQDARILIIDERRRQGQILANNETTNNTSKLIGEYFVIDRVRSSIG